MVKLGFVGTGHIAAPMVRLLCEKGHQVTVTERSRDVSAALADRHGVAVTDTQGVLDASEIVVLAVRPHQLDAALDGITWRPEHRVISVMAATPEAKLRQICTPATQFVQTIPLGYLEHGGCPLPAYGDANLLAELFSPENPVIPVSSEAALNAHFSITALVPGLLDLMATGADWLATETGDPAGAEAYTTHLVAGFLAAMEKRPGGLASERDALATEGTLSLQMTETLRTGGAHTALSEACTAIRERLAKA